MAAYHTVDYKDINTDYQCWTNMKVRGKRDEAYFAEYVSLKDNCGTQPITTVLLRTLLVTV